MSTHTLTIEERCPQCMGTGLYRGMAERDGFAVVCRKCKGTGKYIWTYTYRDFEGRIARDDVVTVLEANPGICVGVGANGKYDHQSFGGMPYADWLAGNPFDPGMEMREFTCPCWWYQTADYKRKPDWDECALGGRFSDCPHFPDKAKCWERWDREQEEKDAS